jgi:hypothetical protein
MSYRNRPVCLTSQGISSSLSTTETFCLKVPRCDNNSCVFLGNEGDSDDDLPPLERNFNHPEDEENEGEEEDDDDSDVSEDEVDEEEQEVGNKCGDASEQNDSPVKKMVLNEEQGLESMLTKSSLND